MLYGVGQSLGSRSPSALFGLDRGITGGRSAPSLGVSEESDKTAADLFKKETKEISQVGFGDGTVSVMGEAAKAIDKGVKSVRRIVPEVTDLLRAQQERRSEQTRDLGRQTERRRLDVQAEARTFINRLNEAAGAVPLQRSSDSEGTATEQSGARITVNGTTLGFSVGTTSGSKLNVAG